MKFKVNTFSMFFLVYLKMHYFVYCGYVMLWELVGFMNNSWWTEVHYTCSIYTLLWRQTHRCYGRISYIFTTDMLLLGSFDWEYNDINFIHSLCWRNWNYLGITHIWSAWNGKWWNGVTVTRWQLDINTRHKKLKEISQAMFAFIGCIFQNSLFYFFLLVAL